jgi:hypothetical protein
MAKAVRKLSPWIYTSQCSVRAIVDSRGHRKGTRFERGTPVVEIKRWRNAAQVRLDRVAGCRRQPSPGLAASVTRRAPTSMVNAQP